MPTVIVLVIIGAILATLMVIISPKDWLGPH